MDCLPRFVPAPNLEDIHSAMSLATSAAERISPLSCQMPRGCSGWGFLSSRPSCAVVSARLEGSTRVLPTLDS